MTNIGEIAPKLEERINKVQASFQDTLLKTMGGEKGAPKSKMDSDNPNLNILPQDT